MATIKKGITYRCNDDCRMEGCPSHKATLEFQSVSDCYHFNINGQEIYLERGAMEAFVDLS